MVSPSPRATRSPHVHKFGGASLADGAAFQQAVAIIERPADRPSVVVVSAMAGLTDALLAIALRAKAGDAAGARASAAILRERHAEAARRALPPGSLRRGVLAHIDEAFAELESMGHSNPTDNLTPALSGGGAGHQLREAPYQRDPTLADSNNADGTCRPLKRVVRCSCS